MTKTSTGGLEWELRIFRINAGNTLWNLWLYPVFEDGFDEDAGFFTRIHLAGVDFDEFWWGAVSGARNHFRTASWGGSPDFDGTVDEILAHLNEQIQEHTFDGWLERRRQVNARLLARRSASAAPAHS